MTYILPVLYVIVSYTFFLLAGCFDNAIKLQILSILLPFIMGIVNLIVVLTVGRKWSRKTLLNCTLIIKYELIPFYLIGGSITVYVTLMAFFIQTDDWRYCYYEKSMANFQHCGSLWSCMPDL